ncbi:hypothetical protein PybrP1_002697 [[Pythium] brassicae (nom. inval.)]|nr:hypothetical protein PybrP1_002697 [[Pythium] brassicae (nom. inval.)]
MFGPHKIAHEHYLVDDGNDSDYMPPPTNDRDDSTTQAINLTLLSDEDGEKVEQQKAFKKKQHGRVASSAFSTRRTCRAWSCLVSARWIGVCVRTFGICSTNTCANDVSSMFCANNYCRNGRSC